MLRIVLLQLGLDLFWIAARLKSAHDLREIAWTTVRTSLRKDFEVVLVDCLHLLFKLGKLGICIHQVLLVQFRPILL